MSDRVLVTGGAGFVGTNMVSRLAREGRDVVVLDDLSRAGVEHNLSWLERNHGGQIEFVLADVGDAGAVRRALQGVDTVFHLAAQVAVTTSVSDPVHDFTTNLVGTMRLLEEVRRLDDPPKLLFTSTNKVYGGLEDVVIETRGDRYVPADETARTYGMSEERPLQFCSPYGCSKGGADQYVLDYAKTFQLRTIVFRMSCIYGPHQQGNEDQGWVAHFVREALAGRPLTIYGDGRQVRDALFVDDLLDAMLLAVDSLDAVDAPDTLAGRAFNIGGGPRNTVSLLELLDMLAAMSGERPEVNFGPWRTGDQRWYVSDTRAFEAATGWSPKVGVAEGVRRLHEWLVNDSHLAAAEAF